MWIEILRMFQIVIQRLQTSARMYGHRGNHFNARAATITAMMGIVTILTNVKKITGALTTVNATIRTVTMSAIVMLGTSRLTTGIAKILTNVNKITQGCINSRVYHFLE